MAIPNSKPAPGAWQEKPASLKATAYLRKLILSSAIKAQDADCVARYLDSGRATAGRVSDGIDWAKERIDARDGDRQASTERKAQYRGKKAASAGRPYRTAQERKAIAAEMRARPPQPADVLFAEPPEYMARDETDAAYWS